MRTVGPRNRRSTVSRCLLQRLIFRMPPSSLRLKDTSGMTIRYRGVLGLDKNARITLGNVDLKVLKLSRLPTGLGQL